ncbi:hypothetical protein QIW52_17625 [Clostridioides difficile]|nr:hypothetical protein [Clostridioides difficile]
MKNYEIKNHTIEVDFSNYRINKRLLDYFIYNENDVKTAYIEAILKNKDEIIDLSEYDKVLVSITKSDGQKVNNECEVVDATNGVVEIELSRQALASVGINTFQLSLVKNNTLINTTNLFYRVEEGMINDDDLTSTDEYGVLLVLISQVEEIIKNNKELTKRVEQLEITILGNEEVRDKAEQIRIYNEDIRNIQEDDREFNELTRQNQEENREESIQNMQIQVDDKLTDCQLQLDEIIDSKSEEIDDIVDDKMLDVQAQTDKKFQDLDRIFEDKLTDNQEQIDYKLDEVNQSISDIETCIDESTIKLDSKIKEVDNKIVEVDTAKTNMTTTVKDKINELDDKFAGLAELDVRGEVINARETTDGSIKPSLKERLNYDFNNVDEIINDKVNEINLKLSDKASKGDLDKAIQGDINVATSKDILTNDWILEEGVYTTIIEHNLVTRKILVSLMDKITNKNVFCSYQILDTNNIKIFNKYNNELECIVVNGNSAINMVSATINDNRISETTTYSSVKVESLLKALGNRIDDIENLKEIDNIRCSTDTGEYIIKNSKKGYVTNFNIQGKTLVNLANPNNVSITDGVRYTNPFKYIESGKTYTFMNLGDKQIKYIYGGIEGLKVAAKSKVLYTIPDSINILEIMCYGHISDGWGETDEDKQQLSQSMLVLEGDYTIEDIEYVEYFDGLQSVGQGDNIKLLSYQGENLFDGTYQNGYFNGDSLDEELIQGMPCITTNWIECNPNTEYHFLGGNRKQIQFKNENNIFKSVILNSNNFETPTDCTHFRLYYARTNQFYLPLNIYKKGDIKTVPYTLRSLPDGIRDEIIYKDSCYKLIQRCEEITLDGQSFWSEFTTNSNDTTLLFKNPIGTSQSNNTNLYCDMFKPAIIFDKTNTIEGIYETSNNIWIRIFKSRLSTPDLEGFNLWLNNNKVTLVRTLKEHKEIDVPSINLEQYDNQTKFSCNSNVIPGISFECTQNLGSQIEAIKSSIKNINHIQSSPRIMDLSNKLLNGWKRTVSDNNGFIISKNGNQVSFHMRITGGATTDGTTLLKLPSGFIPKNFYVFPVFTTQSNQLVQGFIFFNFGNGHLQITQLGSNVDIYSYGTYFIE